MEINHLPQSYGIRKGAEEFPLMVVVSSSYVCNSKCPSCPFTQSSLRNSFKDALFVDAEIFKKIARECGEYNAILRITGGGEPLLHPQMIGLIEYTKSVNAKVGLITNGSLLNHDRVNRLLSAGIDAIEISADAADEETYAKVRTGLNFNTLVENVIYLMYKRNSTNSKTKVIVSIVNQQAIGDKLNSAVEFWKYYVDNVQVRKYLTWGINDPKQSADDTPFIKDRVPCPFPFERINVDSRGKVVLCSYDIVGQTDFGNVKDLSIKEIWRGQKLENYRNNLLEGNYENIDICSKCPDWKYRSWNYNYWNILKNAERNK